MKTTQLLTLVAALIAGATFMTACSHSDDSMPAQTTPPPPAAMQQNPTTAPTPQSMPGS